MSTSTSTKANKSTASKEVAVKAKQATDNKEQAKLDGLITAVKTGFATISGQQSKVVEAVSIAIQLAEVRDNARVATARALAELAKHPATLSTSGTSKGQPALSKIATLVGMPRNTIRPLFDGAMALTEKKWERRTAVPTPAERALVASFYGDEVLRKQEAAEQAKQEEQQGKGKGKGPNTKQVKKIQATLEGVVEAADVLDQTVAAFTKSNGLTPAQFEALETKLGNILVALKKSVPESSTK